MPEEKSNDLLHNPSRREMLQTGVAGAAALGAIGSGAFLGGVAHAQTTESGSAGKHKLIASCWAHMGSVKPFTGQMWSPVSFEYRARHVAEAGFAGMGIFHDDLAHILRSEAKGSSQAEKLQWMKSVLDDHGLDTNELEFLVKWMFPKGHPGRDGEQPIRDLLVEAANVLKPTNFKCGNFGDPVSIETANQGFRDLCAELEPSGAMVCMEILPPDPNGQTLDDALAVCEGPENGGVFLDTWHVNTLPDISYADIAALKPGQIVGVELDDGWFIEEEYKPYFDRIGAPGFVEMTVNCRKCLGEGNFDVVGFIKALAESGFTGPWGNEILSEELRRLPIEMAVRHIYATSLPHIEAALDGKELPSMVSPNSD